MNRHRTTALALVFLLLVPALLVGTVALAPGARAAATPPVTGSMTGPTVVSPGSVELYHVFGWGGPAVAANGTRVGNVSYYTTVLAGNLTGVSFVPAQGNFTTNTSLSANLTAANTTEAITIDVMISSVFGGKNDSTNFTYTVNVVQPYVVSTTIVNTSSATVSSFAVLVLLDGNVIGTVNVSSLLAGASYVVTFKYPTLGLSSGSHTFSLSLVQAHGLVRFANGQSSYSVTFYVAGPPPNYTVWYVAGIVAFFGAIFIFASRVAARRRGAARR